MCAKGWSVRAAGRGVRARVASAACYAHVLRLRLTEYMGVLAGSHDGGVRPSELSPQRHGGSAMYPASSNLSAVMLPLPNVDI